MDIIVEISKQVASKICDLAKKKKNLMFDCWKSEKNGLNKRKALGPL